MAMQTHALDPDPPIFWRLTSATSGSADIQTPPFGIRLKHPHAKQLWEPQ